MLDRDRLVKEVAAYKKDSRKHFDEAVAALIALAWAGRKPDFAYSADEALWGKALALCIALSDKCAESARKRLVSAISDTFDRLNEELIWNEAYDAETQESLDMAGSHLLDLLAIWIGVAATNGWTQGYTRVMVSRYLTNPFLCPEWKSIPLSALAWGRGYARDVAEQIALIGQDAIIGGAMYAEWVDAAEKGATYYIRHRGSGYDCPECDSLCGFPIPIEQPFEFLHARCMCWPEYFYEPLPTL